MSQEIVLQPGESVTITAALPDPEPEPPQWDRIVPAGSHGDFTFATDGERVMFVPGAIVRGTIRISAKNVVLHGFTTTSETARETPVILLKGSSGVLEDYHIEHIGTPSNGKGYSSISANDGNAGVGWAGPWTMRRFVQDQRAYQHMGLETWGIRELVIEDGTFKGNGCHISIPRSDGAVIRRNKFDVAQSFWGIELADIDDAKVLDNTATGKGAAGATWNAFVQMHPGSGRIDRTLIEGNTLTNHPALFNAAESKTIGTIVKDNCLQNVGRVYWGNPPAGSLTASNNKPC